MEPTPIASSLDSRTSLREIHSINAHHLLSRPESYEGRERKCISDVRRTFCLFVTFDLLFVSLLWIIELNVNGGIMDRIVQEVVHIDYYCTFFDIFLLSAFRFIVLIFVYALLKVHHWWAVAITTAVSSVYLVVKVILSKIISLGPFGYLLPIMSFILAWIETWFLDFKVLPQELDEENRVRLIRDASEQDVLIRPGPNSDGLFYSPPESVIDSDEETEEKHDEEKPID